MISDVIANEKIFGYCRHEFSILQQDLFTHKIFQRH